HITANGNEVSIMFRNWLNDSRDLYLTTSFNNGESFFPVQKLGTGTWKLNACPMDGGGLTDKPDLETTWRREGTVYYCKPGQPETVIGAGKNSSIATTTSNTFIGYESKDTLRLASLPDKNTEVIGTGEFMKIAVLPDQKIVCVWESGGNIEFKKI